jgi:hypothetical protein
MWLSCFCLVWFGGHQGTHHRLSALLPPSHHMLHNSSINLIHLVPDMYFRCSYKTSQDKTSQPKNVPTPKGPSLKTSQAPKRPNPITSQPQNVPSHKTSQASKHPTYKTSQLQKVPTIKRPKPQNVPTLLWKKSYIFYFSSDDGNLYNWGLRANKYIYHGNLLHYSLFMFNKYIFI